MQRTAVENLRANDEPVIPGLELEMSELPRQSFARRLSMGMQIFRHSFSTEPVAEFSDVNLKLFELF